MDQEALLLRDPHMSWATHLCHTQGGAKPGTRNPEPKSQSSQRVHIYNHQGIGTHNSFCSMVLLGLNSLIVVYMDPLGLQP